MSYDLNKLSHENLNKIYLVLKDIKDQSELRNTTESLDFGHVEGLKGVPKDDHKIIMENLLKYGYVSNTFWPPLYSGECVINMEKSFFDFYKQVKEKIDGEEKIKDTLSFDKEKSVLFFKGHKIKIARQGRKTVAHEILEYIFSQDLKDTSFYSEIADSYDTLKEYNDNPAEWRRLYIACKDIQEKIRKAAKVDDFLVFNTGKTGKIQINKKYL